MSSLQSKKTEEKKAARNKKQILLSNASDNIMFVVFALFLVLITTYKISGDDDLFWHLATGKYILENKVVPSADVFGFVTQGQKWIPFEWGSDVIFYVTYNTGGYTAISVLRTLVILLMFFLYYVMLSRFKVSKTIVLILGTILSFGILERFSPKPQLFSYLFLTLVLFIILEQGYFRRGGLKLFYFLPFVFLIWANMHMGVLTGIVLFGIYVISEMLIYFYPKKYKNERRPPFSKSNILKLVILFPVCVLAMLVNPHGLTTYSYTLSHLQLKVMGQINEWLSPFDEIFLGRFYNLIYIFFLLAAMGVLYYSYKKRDVFAGLLAIVFAVYSTRNARFSIDYQVIIIVFAAVSLDYLVSIIKYKKIKAFIAGGYVLRFLLILVLVFLAVSIQNNSFYRSIGYIRTTGKGIDAYYYPFNMIEFIRKNRIHEIGERPFNSFENGGLFIWTFPGKKNFIDSRNLNDDIVEVYNQIEQRKPGFEQKLNEYRIDYIPWSFPHIVFRPEIMKVSVVAYLVNKPDEWKLVYWDDKSFLFLRNEEKFKELISKYEYKFVNPYNFFYNRKVIDEAIKKSPEIVGQEIERKYSEDSTGVFIRNIIQAFNYRMN